MFELIQAVTTMEKEVAFSIRDAVEIGTVIVLLSGMWWKLESKVNGYGKRTDEAASNALAAKSIGDKNSIELHLATTERAELRERMASAETAIDSVHDELSQERLAVMSTLHANEKAAAERDAKLREELARLTERVDINRIVRSVVSEFKRSES